MTSAAPRAPAKARLSQERFDAGLATAVGLLAAGAIAFHHAHAGQRPYDLGAWLLAATAAAALVIRRRYALWTLGIALGAVIVWMARDYPPGPILASVVVALFTVGSTGDRRRSTIVGAVVVCVGGIVAVLHRQGLELAAVLAGFGWLGASLFAGDATRNRRAYVAAIEQRARDAEQTREEEARRRVDEERVRIARELHDVVAHSIATINVQAGVAAHVMDQQPEQARAALIAIKEASREALRELRATLSVLRDTDDPTAPRAPAPGLEQIPALVETTRSAGMPIEVVCDLPLIAVSPAVGLTAYRIVQEALTNTLRHAGSAHATVTIEMLGDRLTIDVIDDGNGISCAEMAVVPGHGLAGMRERVRALDGHLQVGPSPLGGFRVHAELPVAETSA
jgi:signal transduction histidine kinase